MASRVQLSLIVAAATLAASCGVLDKLNDPSGLAIQKFEATPKEVPPGSSTTLSWSVEGAETVQIDNGIGSVRPKGLLEVTPARTTRYTLSAMGVDSSATASIEVVVGSGASQPSPSASPTPAASPSPTPSPSPSGSPSPAPSASPSPSPAPTPTPTPSPTPGGCGSAAVSAGNCAVSVQKLATLAAGECVQVTRVSVNQACPVTFNTTRSLSFDVVAATSLGNLRWRRAASSGDLLQPSEGSLPSNGTGSVLVNDIVLDQTLTIEIVSGDQPLLRFTLRHW